MGLTYKKGAGWWESMKSSGRQTWYGKGLCF